jgi:glycosyltransferase involved in cell wall biosynthesis
MGFKILLIGSSAGTGLTFYFTRFAVALQSCGNEVIVLSGANEQYAELRNELDRVGIKRYLSDAIDKMDITSLINGTEVAKSIIKKEGSFDIVLGGGVKHSLKVFLATSKLNKRSKTFAIIGSLPNSKIGMSVAALSYNFFYDKCVTLCNYTKNELERVGVNARKMCVIPLFASDLEWFDKAKEAKTNLQNYNLQDMTKPVIFYAASHFHHKGFQYYLMTAAKVLKKYDATFIVGGKGPLTTSLKNSTNKLGISKHVVFTGWISNYHMPYILSNIADVCISTSLVEQLPSYIIECMAARKPVVASSVGGIPEIVTENVNGYLAPPYDYEKTANRTMHLLENSAEARKMGFEGRRIVEERLNMKSSALRLMKVYEELVQS